MQQAGFGATGPDPGADPYCIDFDKRRQNIAELGVVDFLANEPARTAAAVPKCFYFQSDHCRGSGIQDDGSTKTYEWDGHYFFDKARAEGGLYVTNLNLNGHTADPSALPGLPPDWSRSFGPGTGGVITHNDIPADPSCVGQAQNGPPLYAPPAQLGDPCARPETCCASARPARASSSWPSGAGRRRSSSPPRAASGPRGAWGRGRRRGRFGAPGRQRASAAPGSRVPAGSCTEYAVRPSGSSLCTTGRPTARARLAAALRLTR
ncbi:MAG TPA: hypothetical protein VH231_12245 [Solirubrobacteraceae bacterium]|nr:hypothetical protein [Solirubrobacteraceae bacterium]